jgi:hypothetical protein
MKDNIVNELDKMRGATFVTVVVNTEPRMRKTGNPFYGKIRKISRYNGQVNFQYDGAVERQLAKEGKSVDDFRRGESWHVPVIREDGTLTPFCQHKSNGTKYLRFRMLNVIESKYVMSDGSPVDESEVREYLQQGNNYANQGTDNPVKIITVALDNVESLTANGKQID